MSVRAGGHDASVREGAFRFDGAGQCLEASPGPGVETPAGPQLVGRSIHEVLPPHLARRARPALRRAIETRETQTTVATQGTGPELQALEARIFPLGDDEALVVTRDVTSLLFDPLPLPHAQLPTLADVESRYARRVLERVGGNKSLAARILGVGRKTLYRILERSAAQRSATEGSATEGSATERPSGDPTVADEDAARTADEPLA